MDPAWLLSTAATAAAALVAIVGGLLVSRVVSIATERSGLLHSRDDLRARLHQARQHSADLEQRMLAWDADEIIQNHYEDLAALPEDPDLASMIRRSKVSCTPEEIHPFVDHELKRLRAARDVLERLFVEGAPDESMDELVDAGIVAVPPGEEDQYEATFWQLARENPRRRPAGPFDSLLQHVSMDAVSRTMTGIRSVHEQSQYAQEARDAEHGRHEVGALEVQLEQVELALTRVSHPASVGWGAAVLAYFATVGTLFPLVVMAADFHRWWVPWLVVTLFATGLLALLGYVVRSVRRMTSGDNASPP